MSMESFGLTDAGCVRGSNEDCFLIEPDLGLYMVADGMGGSNAGEEAARLSCETVLESVRQSQPRDLESLVQAFQQANHVVRSAAAAHKELEGMGTTLTAVLDCGDWIAIASVGDSRVYCYKNGQLKSITVDQNWVEEIGRGLGISDEQLRRHPMRHVLTMAIGACDGLRVQTHKVKVEPGCLYLVSSDGLHGVVDEEILARALAEERTLASHCHYLIEAARKAGGPDNITAVLLRADSE